MKKVVTGNKLRVGDRVRVINATVGAYGANDCTGVIVDEFPIGTRQSGLGNENSVLIKLDRPVGFEKTPYWRVGTHGTYELLERKKIRKHIEIDVIVKDEVTKVVVGDRVGTSKCKNEDTFNEAYGIILAVAGAYGLSREKREALVDALYDDVKTLEDYDTLEILDELKSRVED